MPENNESVFFHNSGQPALSSGEYVIKANVTLAFEQPAVAGERTRFNTVEQLFYVDGPRFSLSPADIYATYPADNQNSNFGNTLPHIVFKQRTTPWQRKLKLNVENEQTPWMCLLLADESEATFITRLNYKISDFEADKAKTEVPYLLPNLKLTEWEKADMEKKIDTLHIPTDKLKAIMPSLKLLTNLAHVREVELGTNKEQSSITDIHVDENGKPISSFFSTLVCGRAVVPKQNKKYTAYLVSLEGHEKLIDEPNVSISKTHVRMFILYSWNFYTNDKKDFLQICREITPKTLKIEYQGSNTVLKDSFSRGYVPMQHYTRTGNKMISLYKGPFSPFDGSLHKAHWFTNADSALRYSNQTQLFDVSYAAAWQLGRLLALKDKEFSKNLYKWQQQHSLLEQENDGMRALYQGLTGAIIEDREITNNSRTPPKEVFLPEDFMVNYIKGGKANIESLKKQIFPVHSERAVVNDAIKAWLTNLALLKTIPTNYLVPDDKFLPPESLAVFVPDNDWIDALINGALSLADTVSSGKLLNQIRTNDNSNIAGLYQIRSGFMLRSQLIKGWKGVKVQASKKVMVNEGGGQILKTIPIEPMRVEIINNDILLCLYNDHIKQVAVIQPPESLYFDITRVDNLAAEVDSASITPTLLAQKLVSKTIIFEFNASYSDPKK